MHFFKHKKVFIAGHKGMVGSALVRAFDQVDSVEVLVRDRSSLDLREQSDVHEFFEDTKPDYVFIAAARVGGIMANVNHPTEFILENLQIQTNIINSAHKLGVQKLILLGSSCIYPKNAPQPMREEYILSGPLEETNLPYAVAKISGAIACQAIHSEHNKQFLTLMPPNVYGPNDNFDPINSHVIAGLMRRLHEAKINNDKQIKAWGTGKVLREFIHCDDLASVCLHVAGKKSGKAIINVGTGQEITIMDLTQLIASIVGFKGKIMWDTSKPDGTPRKLLDNSVIKEMGWQPRIEFQDGLSQMYDWFLRNSDG